MNKIGNRVPFHKDEALTSFLSRLSASNFCPSVREFCALVDVDLYRAVAGDEGAITGFLEMVEIDPKMVKDRIVTTDKLYNVVNGEVLSRATFVRSRVRYCPCCIADDVENGVERFEARPYMRMHWQVSFVRSCQLHDVALQEGDDAGGDCHDYAKLFAIERHHSRSQNAAPQKHTAFERYIAERLQGHNRRAKWLDELPLYVAGRLCEWVGATILCGKQFTVGDLGPAQWSDAAQRGFDILVCGRESFIEFLKTLHDTFWDKRGHVGGRVLYGRLYERLAHESKDPAYDEIRKIMTETAIEHLPMGPGDEMFGPILTRKLHSIHSASKEMSFHPKTLRKLLESAGWIDEEAVDRTAERIVFDATTLEGFVNRMRDAINWTAGQSYLNATRSVWNILSHGGFIPPALASVEGKPGISPFYHKADLDEFLDRLRSGATAEHDPGAGRLAMLEAVKKANCKYGEIVQLLLDRKLEKASIDPARNGLEAIMVDVQEIRERTALAAHGGLSLVEAYKELAVSDAVLLALIEHGHLASEVAINPINRCPQRIVRPEEIERFESEYVSLFNYAKRLGIHFMKAKGQLDTVGVEPALTKDMVKATFYRWADIRSAAHRFAELHLPFAFA